MKKKLWAIVISLILCFSVIACLSACRAPTLESISITTKPTKTAYLASESFDATGMVVTAYYSDETSKVLSAEEYTISPSGKLPKDCNRITVSYTEGDVTKEATQTVSVSNPAVSAVVKTAPTKTVYLTGEYFDPAGMVITVTYSDESTKDITVTEDTSITYKTSGLTKEDTSITLTIGTVTVSQPLSIGTGVYIEAENALIDSVDADINSDSTEASGGYYVGDMKSEDSISFVFTADKAGTADIYFRLASQYLKQDDNWTPILMGDCQFNKIVMFSVNGTQYTISNDVILPGGGTLNGTPDNTLWFNWKEVKFEDITLVAGENIIKLEFIAHDYDDCSQESFNNKFTANVDSLKVETYGVEITQEIYEFAINEVSIEVIENKPYFVIEGDATGYTEEYLLLDFQQNTTWISLAGEGIEYDVQINETAGTFKILFDMTQLSVDGGNTWYPHLKIQGRAGNGDINAESVGYVADVVITCDGYVYTSYTDAWGLTGVRRTPDPAIQAVIDAVTLTVTDVALSVSGDKVYYEIKGTYTGVEESVLSAFDAKWFTFDIQMNPQSAQDGGESWDRVYCTVTMTVSGENFTISYDITDVAPYHYTTHFGKSGTPDLKLSSAFDGTETGKNATLGGKAYKLVSVPGSGEGSNFWGCVGLIITAVEE